MRVEVRDVLRYGMTVGGGVGVFGGGGHAGWRLQRASKQAQLDFLSVMARLAFAGPGKVVQGQAAASANRGDNRL